MSSGLQIINGSSSIIPQILVIPNSTNLAPIVGSVSYDPITKQLNVINSNGETLALPAIDYYSYLFGSPLPDRTLSIAVTTFNTNFGFSNLGADLQFFMPAAGPINDGLILPNSLQTFGGTKTFNNGLTATFTNSTFTDQSNRIDANSLRVVGGGSVTILNPPQQNSPQQILIADFPNSAKWDVAQLSSTTLSSINEQFTADITFYIPSLASREGLSFFIDSGDNKLIIITPPADGSGNGGVVTNIAQAFTGVKTFTGNTTLNGNTDFTSLSVDSSSTVYADSLGAVGTPEVVVGTSPAPVAGDVLLTTSPTTATWQTLFNTPATTIENNVAAYPVNINSGPKGTSGYDALLLTTNNNLSNTATWQKLTTNIARTQTSQDYYFNQNLVIGNMTYTSFFGGIFNFPTLGASNTTFSFDPFGFFSPLGSFTQVNFNSSITRNVLVEFSGSIRANSGIDANANYLIKVNFGAQQISQTICQFSAISLLNNKQSQLYGFCIFPIPLTGLSQMYIYMQIIGSDNFSHSILLEQANIKYTVLAQ